MREGMRQRLDNRRAQEEQEDSASGSGSEDEEEGTGVSVLLMKAAAALYVVVWNRASSFLSFGLTFVRSLAGPSEPQGEEKGTETGSTASGAGGTRCAAEQEVSI